MFIHVFETIWHYTFHPSGDGGRKKEKNSRCSSCRGWVCASVSMGHGVCEWVKERGKKTSLHQNEYKYNLRSSATTQKQTIGNCRTPWKHVHQQPQTAKPLLPLRRILILPTRDSPSLKPSCELKEAKHAWDLVACIGPLGKAHCLINAHHAKRGGPRKVPRDICDLGQ